MVSQNFFRYTRLTRVCDHHSVPHDVARQLASSGRSLLITLIALASVAASAFPVGQRRGLEPIPPTRTGLPAATEIKEALAPPGLAREFVAEPKDQTGNLGRRIHTFLNSVCDSPVSRSAVVTWRMLVLFYPHTDSDYKTLEGETKHFKGSLAPDQIKIAERAMAELPGLVKWHSGGLVKLDLTIRTIPRPVTFSAENAQRYGFQYPFTQTDCRPEMDQFNNPRHDSVIVLYHPGPIPQDLRGSGGGGRDGTVARINYGGDGMWTGLTIDNMGVFVHEWMHGLDGYFGSQGYRIQPLHHLYASNYQNRWHSPLMQGRLIDPYDRMYGYSRAAWMSGPPTAREALPPVQAVFPAAGLQMAAGRPIRFEWSPTPSPSGYQLLIYSEGSYSVPLRTVNTLAMAPDATIGDLPPGRYVYTVIARDGDKRSAVGDAVPFSVVPEASMEPIRISRLSTEALVADGRAVPVILSAKSPAGIARVQASLVLPDGTTTTAFLRRRSPNENESTFIGDLWLPPIESTAPMRALVRLLVVDHSGRTASGDSAAVLIQPNGRPGFEKPGGIVPMRVRLPSRVQDNHITSSPQQMMVQFSPERPLAETRGNTWIELTSPSGQKRWIAVEDRRWDDAANSERPAYFRFTFDGDSPNQIWQMAVCFRDAQGVVTRQEHKLVLGPSGIPTGHGPAAFVPGKADGLTVAGFAAQNGSWRRTGEGDGLLFASFPPATAYRIRATMAGKNDLVVFARDKAPGPGSKPDREGLSVVIGGEQNTLCTIRWNGRDIARTSRFRLPLDNPVEVIVTRIGGQVMVHIDGRSLMTGMIPGEQVAHSVVGVFAGADGQQTVSAFEFESYGEAANL